MWCVRAGLVWFGSLVECIVLLGFRGLGSASIMPYCITRMNEKEHGYPNCGFRSSRHLNEHHGESSYPQICISNLPIRSISIAVSSVIVNHFGIPPHQQPLQALPAALLHTAYPQKHNPSQPISKLPIPPIRNIRKLNILLMPAQHSLTRQLVASLVLPNVVGSQDERQHDCHCAGDHDGDFGGDVGGCGRGGEG